MSIHPKRSLTVAIFTLLIVGCSKNDDDSAAAASNPIRLTQAVQSSIASAQPSHAPDPLDASSSSTMNMGAPTTDAPMNMGATPTSALTGMARMLGQAPTVDNSGSGLPPAIGAPHIYHVGANGFFLDQASAIGLTGDQQKRLTALKEDAATAFATTQRKLDQGEQDLWVLSSSEAPQIAKIETKVGEIARLSGQQRMDFIRKVGEAVGVLSDAQRKAVASQGSTQLPTAAPSATGTGMNMAGAPTSSAMGMGMGMEKGMGMGGASKKGMGSGGGMGGMGDAAPSGMGHM